MQIDLVPIIVGLVTLVTTVAVTLYVKDYLQKRNEYEKLRRKLEKIAGKQAPILCQGTGFGGHQLFKIVGGNGPRVRASAPVEAGQMPRFQVDTVPEDDAFAESESRLRVVPFNELLDRVPVSSLSIRRTEAVQNG